MERAEHARDVGQYLEERRASLDHLHAKVIAERDDARTNFEI
jgi:hypothetical protein